jgi:UPF0271 protein
MQIDLNVDCGERFGIWNFADDEEILHYVSSANVACGGHAGDPEVMRKTVQMAKQLKVAIGAHPGYPDMQGFGRRILPLKPDEIYSIVLAQIGSLYAIAKGEGVELTHVKPHGALYLYAATNTRVADAIAKAVAAFSKTLIFYGLAGSELVSAGKHYGLHVAQEVSADRLYDDDGTMRSREFKDAVIIDNAQSLKQVLNVIKHGYLVTASGIQIKVRADTLSLHSDTLGAAARAAYLKRGLSANGIHLSAIPHSSTFTPKHV